MIVVALIIIALLVIDILLYLWMHAVDAKIEKHYRKIRRLEVQMKYQLEKDEEDED